MNTDIDLDIQNYSIDDIEYFFGLETSNHYTASDIEEREYDIRTQLLNGGSFNSKFKRDFVEFVNAAKQKLIDVKIKPKTPLPATTLPKNVQLDPVDYPRSEQPMPRSQELVMHPDTPFRHIQSSEFYAGNLNPLDTRILTKSMTIDTKFRENIKYSTTSSDFVIQLPIKLTKVVSMQLSSIEFPVSYYGISNSYGNNFMHMEILYHDASMVDHRLQSEIVIPDGNYTAGCVVSTLNSILGSKTGTVLTPDPTNLFSYVVFSLNARTGRITVTADADQVDPSGNVFDSIILDFSKDLTGVTDPAYPITSRFGWCLGFTKTTYEGSTSYTSDTIAQPSPMHYAYLSIDDYNNNMNNQFIATFQNSISDPNIMARITLNAEYFSLITDTDQNIVTEPRQYFGPVDIQRLHIRLYDDHGRLLDMNNADYSFCLTFKLLYNL
jgi:hypothetical protein